jgi:hypothetical protein
MARVVLGGAHDAEFIVEFPECDQGRSELARRLLLNPEQ